MAQAITFRCVDNDPPLPVRDPMGSAYIRLHTVVEAPNSASVGIKTQNQKADAVLGQPRPFPSLHRCTVIRLLIRVPSTACLRGIGAAKPANQDGYSFTFFSTCSARILRNACTSRLERGASSVVALSFSYYRSFWTVSVETKAG